MPRLLGQHIQLREYQADDLEAICQWVNDKATTRLLSTAYWPPQTLVDTEEFLQRMLQSSHNAFNFVIADREDGRYLGQLDMFTVDWRLRCGKLGMVILDEGAGQIQSLEFEGALHCSFRFVDSLAMASRAARELLIEGATFIETCSWFDDEKTRALISTLASDTVPVGTAGRNLICL